MSKTTIDFREHLALAAYNHHALEFNLTESDKQLARAAKRCLDENRNEANERDALKAEKAESSRG